MENEILENKPIKETNKTKKLIMIIGTALVFIGLLVLAIIVFKEPVKVSFAAPGKLGFSLDAAIVDKDGKIEVPNDKQLIQEHYTFLGWYKNAEGKGEALDLANMTFTESITVYAIWDVIEYTITYDLDGGQFTELTEAQKGYNLEYYTVSHDKLAINDETRNNNDWKMNATELNAFIQETGLRLTEPTKASATFDGWDILDENGNKITGITVSSLRLTPKGNITLKARWV